MTGRDIRTVSLQDIGDFWALKRGRFDWMRVEGFQIAPFARERDETRHVSVENIYWRIV